MSDEQIVTFSVEEEVAKIRQVMRQADPITLECHRLAEGYARNVRAHFHGRDLALAAEMMIISAGALAMFTNNNTSRVGVNIQAFAAVLILDAVTVADCPECEQRKCQNCTGEVLAPDEAAEPWLTCPCKARGHKARL
jgi:hypothetical protein